jgi:hypothetical protein
VNAAAGIPGGVNGPVKAAGIPGGVNGPVKGPGTVGGTNGPNEMLGIVGVANVPVTVGIVGALGIGKADVIVPLVELKMPGIGGGMAVKLAVNRFVKTTCKLRASSTPPRREEVAGFC